MAEGNRCKAEPTKIVDANCCGCGANTDYNQRSSFVKMYRFVDADKLGVRLHKWANQNGLVVGISMKCEIVKQNKLRRKYVLL